MDRIDSLPAPYGAGRRSGQGQGDDGGGDDVVDLGAARQVGDRLGEALEDRADGGGAGQVAGQLVAEIGGVQVREDQHVGPAGDRAVAGELGRGDRRDEGAVGLQLAVLSPVPAPAPWHGLARLERKML